MTGLGTGNSYLSEIVPGTMYKDLCDEMNISRRVLSRTLEDSGTVVVPLIPWSAAGIYMSTVLGVSVAEYAPWAVRGKKTFLVDATPIDLDFNFRRNKKTKEHLKPPQ